MLTVREIKELKSSGSDRYLHQSSKKIKLDYDGACSSVHELEHEQKIKFRPPICVVGSPHDDSCLKGVLHEREVIVPPLGMVEIHDAQPVGYEAVLNKAGALHVSKGFLNSGQINRHAAETASGQYGYLLDKNEGDWYISSQNTAIIENAEISAAMISGVEPGNFGSFLLRMLPQLLALKEGTVEYDCLIVPERTPWLMEALKLLEMGSKMTMSVREASSFTFDKVWKFQNFYSEGLISQSTMKRFHEFASRCNPQDSALRSKKIYMSRRFQSLSRPEYRPLLNEDDIEDAVKSIGYAVFHPECWSLEHQIGQLMNANRICGPSGSGMLVSAFSESGARVLDIESYTSNVRQHAYLYSSSSKDYGFCFGQIDDASALNIIRSPWRAAVDDILSGLEALS